MSLNGIISAFQTGTYTVTRQATGAYSAGVWAPGADSTFTVDGVIQPASGDDLQILPEGLHIENVRILWTTTQLRAGTGDTGADEVAIGSDSYKVIAVEDWQGIAGTGGNHYKITIGRLVP